MCDRTILCIRGPDAKSFLQNLVTNDVTKLKNNIIYAALLTPQGPRLVNPPRSSHFNWRVSQPPNYGRCCFGW